MWRALSLIIFATASAVATTAATSAFAQAASSTVEAGTVVTLSADGDVHAINDQVVVTLTLEEQDKDKAVAASHLNQKMRQGSDIVKREDPTAILKTRGYYTVPVYSEEPLKAVTKLRPIIGWRVGQSLEMRTMNLLALPATIAAAQRILSLNNLSYSLSENATRQLDDERIRITYRNLTARIAAVAKAMGRNPADATIESIDIDNAAAQIQPRYAEASMKAIRSSADADSVVEPSFEPGETVLHLRMVSKLHFR